MTNGRLRKQFLAYGEKLKTEGNEAGQRIIDKVDELVEWYELNRREMTWKEFLDLLGGFGEES